MIHPIKCELDIDIHLFVKAKLYGDMWQFKKDH
jgi:hypothetical protein